MAPKVPWWTHNSATIIRLVRQCIRADDVTNSALLEPGQFSERLWSPIWHSFLQKQAGVPNLFLLTLDLYPLWDPLWLTVSESWMTQTDGSAADMTIRCWSDVHSIDPWPDFRWTTTLVRSSSGWCRTRRLGFEAEILRPDSRSRMRPNLLRFYRK